ncbi:hypothetical protein [Haloplanus aerogenes]|uniref:Uncharacterized protein n=1 Tax=Haloplanus aerogenes TaxID=660522 RepID=A0A3M0DS57_9EURY|nr:hypothetical protein [Haloplanus aerogenes]AZH24730.1 hypothetical protein DU502_04720 [Haloplanus aerogenes]RMB23610.1 hypothetical protein ATH50_0830 [Haloplanus aerogenes]
MTGTHLVAFDPSSDEATIQRVLGRVVAGGGELVFVAGGGVIVRAPEVVVEALGADPAVRHVGGVTLPDRAPARIRRPASE